LEGWWALREKSAYQAAPPEQLHYLGKKTRPALCCRNGSQPKRILAASLSARSSTVRLTAHSLVELADCDSADFEVARAGCALSLGAIEFFKRLGHFRWCKAALLSAQAARWLNHLGV
jgi:hypothetical protein